MIAQLRLFTFLIQCSESDEFQRQDIICDFMLHFVVRKAAFMAQMSKKKVLNFDEEQKENIFACVHHLFTFYHVDDGGFYLVHASSGDILKVQTFYPPPAIFDQP